MHPNVVILGSSGFVGSALLDSFRREGIRRILGYNSSTLDLASRDSIDRLASQLDDGTLLIITTRSRSFSDPYRQFLSDIAINANIASALAQRKIGKCFYFSSTSVYGDSHTDLSISEETPIAPTSLYGKARFAGECTLREVAVQTEIPLVIVRPCMIYGPGDTSEAYGPARLIKSMVQGDSISLYGDGSELRDYIFISDLAGITTRLAVGDFTGTYNLATGHCHSFTEILECLQLLTPKRLKVTHQDRLKPKVDQRINPGRLLAALPNLQFTDLREGLAAAYGYFSRQRSA